jgi:cold shock CspA family protein
MLTGRVTEFDAGRGLGMVHADDGGDYLFHLIEIADGTRTIDVGQPVVFERLPRFGRFQAGRLVQV